MRQLDTELDDVPVLALWRGMTRGTPRTILVHAADDDDE